MQGDENRDPTEEGEALQWEQVSLTPDPAEVAAIEEVLPQEWLQPLQEEPEPDPFEHLYTMSDQDLRAEVGESVHTFDIDVNELIDDIKGPDMDLDLSPPGQDFDFGR